MFRINAFYKEGEFDTAKKILEVNLKSYPNEERLTSIFKKIQNFETKKRQVILTLNYFLI